MLARIETTEERVGGMRIKGMQRQLGSSPPLTFRSGGGGGTVRGFLWDACEKRGGKEFPFRRVISSRAASDDQANLPASPSRVVLRSSPRETARILFIIC